MATKRVLACGDLHSGHRVGLTPPKYQSAIPGDVYHKIQIECWDYWRREVEKLLPIDILIVNGDAIDGTGHRSGGTELLTTDINRQCDIAVECLEWIGAKRTFMTYGTPYHTGVENDEERKIADRLGADIRGQHWLDVNGTVFDVRHHIGGTSVPYGKGTQISKERLWNYIWTEFGEQPKADIILRSHVHDFFQCGPGDWLGVILPALQGQGSKFGSRKCSGKVDFGFTYFDCHDDGSYDFQWRKVVLESQKREAIKL